MRYGTSDGRRLTDQERALLEANTAALIAYFEEQELARLEQEQQRLAIYNCFELASIEDRSIFKGHVDFIVATEFNRDTSYFSNIVEAADIHAHTQRPAQRYCR